jgi:hypothetical protein
MKKIILSTIAAFFGLALMASPSYAQAVFNSPGEMPTVTIVNSTRTVCNYGPINGCWQSSTTAQAGDVVAVHIYYKNTSNTAAQGTTLGLTPQSSSATTAVSFSGGVASLSGPRAVGSASLSISSSQTVTYIPGSGKWYPSATSGTRPIDSNALFGTSGFNVGTVNPGEQGVLVAFFQVSNTTTTYQCSDGIDNDGDGLIDYPADPGCTSATDNDEYNVTAQCVIDTFYASPTNVTSGGYTTLQWNTTGCDNVIIDGVTYPVDGSGSFGPLYSSRNYELRATRGSSVATRQAYVSVNQVNNTYQCNDGYDNDGDGKIDFPNDPGCSSYTDNDEYNAIIINNIQPQAITTVASAVGKTSATLNGIAVPNSVYNTTSWFEWGTSSSLGFRTNSQTVNTNSSTYYNSPISGLISGVNYYYRAVVQNQNGTAYGDIVRFQTDKTTVIVTSPPKVITKVITQRDVVIAKSTASLLELRVENIYDRMCVGGEMDYTVTYRNISSQTLQNTVLRITHPKELTFINSSRGDYEVVDRTVTISLGDVRPGEQGTIQVRARVNTQAITGNLAVTTATVVYTNTITRAQEDAIAYSLITVSNDCPNVLGASAFGISSFFPHTLVGWLLLILVILALIVITRQIYKKKEQQ